MLKYRGITDTLRKALSNMEFGWIKVYRLGLWRDLFCSSLGRRREGGGDGDRSGRESQDPGRASHINLCSIY